MFARELRTEAEKLPWHTTGWQRRAVSYVSEVLLGMWRVVHTGEGFDRQPKGDQFYGHMDPKGAPQYRCNVVL